MGKRINGVGAAATVALGMVVMTGAPAWADSTQYMYCVFGETGRANWRESEDYAGIFGITFIWRSVHNDIMENPEDQYWFDGPAWIKATAYGNDYWAPYAIRLAWDTPSIRARGTACEEGASKNIDGLGLGSSPVYQSVRGNVPPTPGTVVSFNDVVQDTLDSISQQ